MRLLARLVLFPALWVACATMQAQPKSLYWRALDVRARLDEMGRLQVTERHAMVFTGDWNGGERVFSIRSGQSLAFQGLSRIDASGEKHVLQPGDLTEVDRYAFKDPVTLRWAPRKLSDPPFDHTEIVYELTYTLSGVLTKLGDVYRLDHDFGFSDRPGPIQAFSLELTLDPVWKPQTRIAPRITSGPIPPGQGYVLPLELAYGGNASPIAKVGTSRGMRAALLVMFVLAVVILFFLFWSGEAAKGRWATTPSPDAIDHAWLQKNVFALRPEEAGALWDEKIGAAEVAAVLSRLCLEKKVSSRADGKKMTLRLLVPLEKISGYEHNLLSGLFFGGRQETDTDAVRAHYKGKGFDPVEKIRGGIEQRLAARPELAEEGSKASAAPALLLFGLSIVAMLYAIFAQEYPFGDLVGWLIGNLIFFAFAAVGAALFRKRLVHPAAALGFLWLPLYFVFSWVQRARAPAGSAPVLLVGVALFQLGIVATLLAIARIPSGAARIAWRKRLIGARAYFERELQSRSPRLTDDWYPYILALGLGPDADRWAKAFGTAPAAAIATSTSESSSRSSSSSSSGTPSTAGEWTGGGGSFGGAGASAGWAAAAASMASGVASPSSSSGGGGGGGGGGGSSGGGGGGGW